MTLLRPALIRIRSPAKNSPDIFSPTSFCPCGSPRQEGLYCLPLSAREPSGKWLTLLSARLGSWNLMEWVSGEGVNYHSSRATYFCLCRLYTAISFDGNCCLRILTSLYRLMTKTRSQWQSLQTFEEPLLSDQSPKDCGNVCCSWPQKRSVPHPNWASGESTILKCSRGHIYLSITRIKVSQLLKVPS